MPNMASPLPAALAGQAQAMAGRRLSQNISWNDSSKVPGTECLQETSGQN